MASISEKTLVQKHRSGFRSDQRSLTGLTSGYRLGSFDLALPQEQRDQEAINLARLRQAHLAPKPETQAPTTQINRDDRIPTPESESDIPDWLKPAYPTEPQPAPANDIPEWMQDSLPAESQPLPANLAPVAATLEPENPTPGNASLTQLGFVLSLPITDEDVLISNYIYRPESIAPDEQPAILASLRTKLQAIVQSGRQLSPELQKFLEPEPIPAESEPTISTTIETPIESESKPVTLGDIIATEANLEPSIFTTSKLILSLNSKSEQDQQLLVYLAGGQATLPENEGFAARATILQMIQTQVNAGRTISPHLLNWLGLTEQPAPQPKPIEPTPEPTPVTDYSHIAPDIKQSAQLVGNYFHHLSPDQLERVKSQLQNFYDFATGRKFNLEPLRAFLLGLRNHLATGQDVSYLSRVIDTLPAPIANRPIISVIDTLRLHPAATTFTAQALETLRAFLTTGQTTDPETVYAALLSFHNPDADIQEYIDKQLLVQLKPHAEAARTQRLAAEAESKRLAQEAATAKAAAEAARKAEADRQRLLTELATHANLNLITTADMATATATAEIAHIQITLRATLANLATTNHDLLQVIAGHPISADRYSAVLTNLETLRSTVSPELQPAFDQLIAQARTQAETVQAQTAKEAYERAVAETAAQIQREQAQVHSNVYTALNQTHSARIAKQIEVTAALSTRPAGEVLPLIEQIANIHPLTEALPLAIDQLNGNPFRQELQSAQLVLTNSLDELRRIATPDLLEMARDGLKLLRDGIEATLKKFDDPQLYNSLDAIYYRGYITLINNALGRVRHASNNHK